MRKQIAVCVLAASAWFAAPVLHAQKSLFYMLNEGPSERDFLAHASQVDILSPAWYSMDGNGLVNGAPNEMVLKAAKAAHDSVVPLVGLANKDQAHALFNDSKAQDAMIGFLIDACKRNGYDGIQFDIEDILWTDRDALSAMMARVADAFHTQHLQVQIATVPNAPGYPEGTAFGKWMYQEWRGAYDLAALAKSVDLICLMTYDQHTRWTEPGPVGGWPWVVENMKYALARVPADKLSLGIALYGYHWYTGDPGLDKPDKTPHPTADYIGYANAESLRASYNGQEQWDPVDKTTWFYIYRDELREYFFVTDKRGYGDRLDLARQNHLAGTCAWVLGEEDPAIWSLLPSHK